MADDRQMIVRLDPALHDGLKRWADAEQRSIAAQVRVVLKDAIPEQYLATDDA